MDISHQRYELAGTNFEYVAPAAAGDQCVASLHGYDRCDIQYFIKGIIRVKNYAKFLKRWILYSEGIMS